MRSRSAAAAERLGIAERMPGAQRGNGGRDGAGGRAGAGLADLHADHGGRAGRQRGRRALAAAITSITMKGGAAAPRPTFSAMAPDSDIADRLARERDLY